MKTMNRRVLVSMPDDLYEGVKRLATREYRSAASLIRESILEKVENEFTPEEWAVVGKGFRDIDDGKGVSWRGVRNE